VPVAAEVLPFTGTVGLLTPAQIRARIRFARTELAALKRLLRQTRAAQRADPRATAGRSSVDDRPMSLDDAARFLGVSKKTISRAIEDGRLQKVEGVGRRVVIAMSSLRAATAGGLV
jgi:excisionase family DNA binding protein